MIDLAKARELLPLAVATQGEDFIYNPGGMDSCFYRPQLGLPDDNPKSKTACLVGVVFALAGIEVPDAWENLQPQEIQRNYFGVMTYDAATYLFRAQWPQDQGGTWGEGLESAEKWYQECFS